MSGRAEEPQLTFEAIPSRFPVARRIQCACGCGRWWYWLRQGQQRGRPPKYATPECYRKVRTASRRANNWERPPRAGRSPFTTCPTSPCPGERS